MQTKLFLLADNLGPVADQILAKNSELGDNLVVFVTPSGDIVNVDEERARIRGRSIAQVLFVRVDPSISGFAANKAFFEALTLTMITACSAG